MSTGSDPSRLREQVMAGLECIFDGDADEVARLPDEAQNLVLIIAARALAEFCDANDGRHEEWGMDEASWARWMANARELVSETEAMLGPWVVDWIDLHWRSQAGGYTTGRKAARRPATLVCSPQEASSSLLTGIPAQIGRGLP